MIKNYEKELKENLKKIVECEKEKSMAEGKVVSLIKKCINDSFNLTSVLEDIKDILPEKYDDGDAVCIEDYDNGQKYEIRINKNFATIEISIRF